MSVERAVKTKRLPLVLRGMRLRASRQPLEIVVPTDVEHACPLATCIAKQVALGRGPRRVREVECECLGDEATHVRGAIDVIGGRSREPVAREAQSVSRRLRMTCSFVGRRPVRSRSIARVVLEGTT
jgi:hypothetical protein